MRTSPRWTPFLSPNPTGPWPPLSPPNRGPTWDTFANHRSNPWRCDKYPTMQSQACGHWFGVKLSPLKETSNTFESNKHFFFKSTKVFLFSFALLASTLWITSGCNWVPFCLPALACLLAVALNTVTWGERRKQMMQQRYMCLWVASCPPVKIKALVFASVLSKKHRNDLTSFNLRWINFSRFARRQRRILRRCSLLIRDAFNLAGEHVLMRFCLKLKVTYLFVRLFIQDSCGAALHDWLSEKTLN